MERLYSLIVMCLALLISISVLAFKKTEREKNIAKLRKFSSGEPKETILNINNITSWVHNDGLFPPPMNLDWNGTFPKGTAGVIFQEGIVFGGLVNDGLDPKLRVIGTAYQTSFTPGAILFNGIAEDPYDPNVRIWRVRRNWDTADLTDDAASFFIKEPSEVTYTDIQQLRMQYETDMLYWPADKGAPFEDVNNNGWYEPYLDIPGIPGADQTIWYVANDLGLFARDLAGSPSIGLELQMTLWGYARPNNDPFGDMTFKRFRVIYKGTPDTPISATITDAYIAQWADPDVGNYEDDFVGCDSTLSLGYAYNSSALDAEYTNSFDLIPPVVGYQLIQGPIVPSSGNTAIFNFRQKFGYKNLPMSSFFRLSQASSDRMPESYDYNGTRQWYNLMLGLRPRPEYPNGQPWLDPSANRPTVFPLSGDPVTSTGWVDGTLVPPSDRLMGFSSGPFTMALGDTQEVVVALLGDIKIMGNRKKDLFNYLKSIDRLKSKSSSVKGFFENEFAANIIGEDLVGLDETVKLTSTWISLDRSMIVTSYQWSLISAPNGSNAQLENTNNGTTVFTPDVKGNYGVSLTLTNSEGNDATGYIDVIALENRAPTAQFILSKTQLTWGDSVLADAGGSSDPEGDSLEYVWGGDGIINPLGDGSTAQITPTISGTNSIELSVRDGLSTSKSTQTIDVHPKIENMRIEYSFVDTSWVQEYFYFHGDTLLVPINKAGIIRVYDISDDGIFHNTDIEIPGIYRVIKLQGNLLYAIVEPDSGPLLFGAGAVSIFLVGNGWQLIPILEKYRPNPARLVTGLVFLEEHTLLRDFLPWSIYKIDFKSNPANPRILAKGDYPSAVYITAPKEVGQYIYVNVRDTSATTNSSLRVLNKNTLNTIMTLNLPENIQNFSIYDTLMFIGFEGTLSIYGISDPLHPYLISDISVSSPQEFVSSYDIHAGRYIENDLLAVKAYSGVKAFNIKDPTNPQAVASWYDGNIFVNFRFHNGAYYVVSASQKSSNPFSGINRISFPFIVSVEESGADNIPKKYVLYQNYPNPFNPETSIKYQLPKNAEVKLEIYNLLGQRVGILVNKEQPAGIYSVQWDGRDDTGKEVASGIYLYRLKTDKFVQVKKLTLLR